MDLITIVVDMYLTTIAFRPVLLNFVVELRSEMMEIVLLRQ